MASHSGLTDPAASADLAVDVAFDGLPNIVQAVVETSSKYMLFEEPAPCHETHAKQTSRRCDSLISTCTLHRPARDDKNDKPRIGTTSDRHEQDVVLPFGMEREETQSNFSLVSPEMQAEPRFDLISSQSQGVKSTEIDASSQDPSQQSISSAASSDLGKFMTNDQKAAGLLIGCHESATEDEVFAHEEQKAMLQAKLQEMKEHLHHVASLFGLKPLHG
jgi:hypothetical protein